MSNRKCPYCQSSNRADAAECERCGFPLTEEDTAAGAYAPGDLAAQPAGAAQPAEAAQSFAPGEAPAAYGVAPGGVPLPYAAAYASRVAPFTRVGAGLNQAWQIYASNFMLITKLVLFAAIPFALAQAALSYRLQDTGSSTFVIVLNTLVFLLVRWSLIPAAVIYAVTKKWATGDAPGVGESYQWAAGHWLRVMRVLLLSSLITGLGMLLLIVPGLILSVMFALVVPVALFETASVTGVLTRSEELTKGVRWPIFWCIVLITLLASVGSSVVSAGFFGLAFIVGPAGLVLANMVSAVVSEVLSQLAVVLALTIYLGRLSPVEQASAIGSVAGAQPQPTAAR